MRPRLYSLFFFLIVILTTRCLLAQSTPSITGLVPTGGPVGASVVISGTGFGATQGSSTVTFSGVAATPTAWSDTSITVSVPAGATTGYVLVTVGGLPGYGMLFAVATSNLTLTGSLNTARMFQTTTLLDNGKILIAGGVDGFGYNTISSAELYSPTTGTFASTGSLNTGRIFNTATLLNNGKVLIAGGTDSNWNNIATSELYDPVAGTFSFTGSMGTPRDSQTATLLNNGKVLMVGGVSSNGIWITGLAANSEVYDPGAGTFSPTGSLATARDCHTATLLNNGKVLIVGGNDVNGYALASAELYDPAAGTFAPTGSLNTGRAVHTASLLNNGMVLVTGGYDFYGNAVGNAELYDPATGTFTVTGSLNTPRYDGAQSVLLNNGMVLIMGGQDNYGNSLNSVELYDPTAGTFSVTGGMNSTRQSLTATLLNNGQVLIVAGMDYYANVLTSAELYQPSSFTPPGLASITLGPQNPSVTVGGSQQLVATGTFSDNSTETLESATWSSTATSIATVSNDASNYGNALGIATGTATISACAGSVCGSTTLTVGSSAPSITTISPVVGVVGTPVTITGAGFGTAQGSSTVTFNGTAGTPTSWGDTSITVPVPAGATTGNVVATVNGLASNGASFTVATPASFAFTGAMSTALSGATATLLNNGTVLILGGWDSNYNILSSTRVFSPTTGAFSATGSLNTGRTSHTMTLLSNGTVLITGGYDHNGNTLASTELYDPTTGIFSTVGNLTLRRSNHTATSLNNGKVLIVGGVDPWGNALTASELYDPTQGTFTATGGLNTARELHSATLLNNGKVLIAGGNDGSGNMLASAELYDPASGTFTVTGNLNVARDPHTATLLNNGMVLIAGGLDANYYALASAELYDPAAGAFTLTGNLNSARQTHTATLLNNGTVLVAGGYDNSGTALASAELYDPTTGTFAVTGNLNTARGSHTATLLGGGAVLFAGGIDNNWNTLASAELYQPSNFTPAGLVSIAITPTNPSILAGSSQQFMATGTFNDNSTQILMSATWSSSANLIASLTNDATNYGNASGVTPGTATVSACTGSICGSTTLTVGSAPVVVPNITSLSPSSGPAGATVTITGTNFGVLQGSSIVTFNGTPASVLTWDGVQIVTHVPQGATSGNVVVTVGGTASNGVPFTVLVPNITSLSPSIGAVGMSVTIAGSNFGATQGTSTVAFNGTTASVVSWSASSIVVQIPSGATTGNVLVTVNGAVSNGVSFTVIPRPDISGVSPTSASTATAVTITGTNFGDTQGSSTVTFNGVAATPTQWSDTGITVPVPSGATTGNLIVSVSGVASNGVRFTVTGTPGFTTAGSLSTARFADTATLLNNGLVLFAGGWDSNYNVLASAELYDPVAGTSSLNGNLNTARDSHTATLLNNGKVLIVGGMNHNNVPQATAEIYDPTTGIFAPTGNLATGRYSHTATLLNNGTVLIAGGLDEWGNILASAEIYDPATGTFALTGSLNTARKAHTATLLDNGIVLVVGGTSGWGSDTDLSSAELYDPANGTFTNTGSLLTARSDATATLLNSRMVLIAGGRDINNSALGSAELYDPNGGNFSATGGLLTGRASHTATLLNNGTILITGGWDINSNILDSTEIYDPVAGTFATTGSLNIARSLATAILLNNGTVLVAGGVDENYTALAGLELYQPTVLIPPGLVSIVISPADPSISGGSSQRFTATGTFNDSSSQTLGSATWSSSDISITILSNDATNYGDALGVGQGTATVSACTGSICGSTTLTVQGPSISTLSPSSGGWGTTVTIVGSRFGATQGSSTVTFNGTTASVTSWSAVQIVAQVPPGATSGNVVVTVGVASNAMPFTVPPPNIASLTPDLGSLGTVVTITGTNFGTAQGTSTVRFNGTTATPASWSDTSIMVSVPEGATTGNVVVTVGGASIAMPFVIPPPSISSITPAIGPEGTVVTITGMEFGGYIGIGSTVTFNGLLAEIIDWSDTDITVPVPVGATSGYVVVTVGGVASNGMPFAAFPAVGATGLTDSMGRTTIYGYQSTGGRNFITSIAGSGCASCGGRGNTTLAYDALGNVQSSTDALGRTTSYTYDSMGNVFTRSQQLNANTTLTWTYTYNSFQEALTSTDPAGNTTTNTYDANGNLLSTTTPPPSGSGSGFTTTFQYNTLGELTQVTDPRGNHTTLTYTPAGFVASVTDAQSNATTFTYDGRGNRLTSTDALNHTTSYTYDAMNRITVITAPDTTTTQFGYDYRGRRTSVTDANGKVATYQYDDADRVVAVTDAAQNVTVYGYDTEGNMVNITDAANHETTFTYDALGRVTQVTFPSTLSESYSYDAMNNLLTKTDRKGQTINLSYDSLYRLTSKTYPDSTAVNYTYDQLSRLTQVTDPTGTYSFTYDNLGRLLSTGTQYSFLSGTLTNSYAYDAASNRTSLTDSAGATSTYSYDSLNQLTGLANTTTGSFGFGYDALGRRTSLTRPNGVDTSYTYDTLSHLLGVLHNGGSLPGSTSYAYDAAGNRTSKTALQEASPNPISVTSNFSYDDIYQLTQAVVGGTLAESYTYDAVGNRATSLDPASYTYNSSNELTSTSAATYTYDNSGNTTSKTDSTGTTYYTWDFENRLASVTLPGTGGTVYFTYDPMGRRVRKVLGSATTIYAYDDENVVEELDSSGNVVGHYTQGAGVDGTLAMTGTGGPYFYHADGLGSVTSLTNSSGQLAASYVYDSFGKLMASTGTITNPFQYTGREFDSETGLYYYRARYYDLAAGRFLSEDPSGFAGGDNFYTYAEDNPTSLVDPYGLHASSSSNSTWGTIEDLGLWFFNQGNRTHSDDAVTSSLRQSPAWQKLRNDIKKANCVPNRYYGDFELNQVFKPHNYDLTIQAVGSFGADVSFNGKTMIVDAFNEWGFKSLTHNPWASYRKPTLEDMIFNGAKKGMPSSILNNTHKGPMAVRRFFYHWTEKSPCCTN